MTVIVDLQQVSGEPGQPGEDQVRQWVAAALEETGRGQDEQHEVTVRIVDEQESRSLNERYRDRDKATNVLSFPFEAPAGLPAAADTVLGDLVICAPVVRDEAARQGKQDNEHWAHMVVHGALHLLGYDHQDDDEAHAMEALETRILERFGIDNPYLTD